MLLSYIVAQLLTRNIDCKYFRVVRLEIRSPQYAMKNSNETARNCNRLDTAWRLSTVDYKLKFTMILFSRKVFTELFLRLPTELNSKFYRKQWLDNNLLSCQITSHVLNIFSTLKRRV